MIYCEKCRCYHPQITGVCPGDLREASERIYTQGWDVNPVPITQERIASLEARVTQLESMERNQMIGPRPADPGLVRSLAVNEPDGGATPPVKINPGAKEGPS